MSVRWNWIGMALLSAALCACSNDEASRDAGPMTDAAARVFLNKHSCNACHEVDELRIGPTYRDVAIRYAYEPEKDADWLAEKIIRGGAGSWGNVPMISNPNLTDTEARSIARWILALETPRN